MRVSRRCILFSCILHTKTDLLTMPVSLFLSLCVHPHRNGSSWNSMNLRQRPKRDAIQRVKGSVWQPYWMRVKIVSKCYFIWYSSCFTSFVDCAESTWALWNLWTNETGAHPVFMCLLARAHTHPLHIIHQSILFALRLLSNFVPKQNHFIFRLCKQCTDTHCLDQGICTVYYRSFAHRWSLLFG